MKNSLVSKKRIIYTILASFIFGAFLFFAFFDASKDNSRNPLRPITTDSPIYVELKNQDELKLDLSIKEDIKLSGLSLLMVNVDKEGDGVLEISISLDNAILASGDIKESDIAAGSWTDIVFESELKEGKVYTLSLTPNDFEPFLMYVPESGMKLLPYEMKVDINGSTIDKCVSVGLIENNSSFGIAPIYILYILVATILFVLIITLIWLDVSGLLDIISRIHADTLIKKYGSDLFLLAVFIFIVIGIYSSAFKNGIFITADSSGYLREAVNLKAGNGFGYDALAGYKSWFANWPILYPFMIFVSMCITGQDSYIASKILTCFLVLLILVVLRIKFKDKAYIYSLALLNLGFIQLSYYTWSEIPFILFLLLFALKLGELVEDENIKIKDYILFGLYGFLVFLTRYFGIFIWVTTGFYILAYFYKYIKERNSIDFKKTVALTITAFISGCMSLGYMFMNKLMNGMASGVSRSEWWDDYRTLTRDLINSLITEIFNVFHIDISSFILRIPYPIKVVFILVCIFGIVILVRKTNLFTRNKALIILSGTYYVMFTVIRYFSSMDTFYFRFFEPASFILTIGIIGIILDNNNVIDKKAVIIKRSLSVVILFLILIGITSYLNEGIMGQDYDYYQVAKAVWNEQYEEVPQKSVVIFSDLDFRSEYYRPDVIGGEIFTYDLISDLAERYYGSDYLVIQKEYARIMIDSGEYTKEVADYLEQGIIEQTEAKKYISLPLN